MHTVHRQYNVRAEYLTRIGNKRVSVSVVEAPNALRAEWRIMRQLRADGLQPIRVTASPASTAPMRGTWCD